MARFDPLFTFIKNYKDLYGRGYKRKEVPRTQRDASPKRIYIYGVINAARAPADREVSIKDSGFTRTGLGVTVLCLHTAT